MEVGYRVASSLLPGIPTIICTVWDKCWGRVWYEGYSTLKEELVLTKTAVRTES